MFKYLLISLLIVSPLLAKPFRAKNNHELLQWYLENPSDNTPVVEKFGRNELTVRRIPAINGVQKIIKLWMPKQKKFKTMKINLKYFKDTTTGWEALQGLTCPLPPKDDSPEVEDCVRGNESAEKLLRVLLSSKIQDLKIKQKTTAATECIKRKLVLPKIELSCFLKALNEDNINKVYKELIAQLRSIGLEVSNGRIVKTK